jgi:hypothetical protein
MLRRVSLLCVVLAVALNHVDAAPVSTDTQAMVGAVPILLVFRELFIWRGKKRQDWPIYFEFYLTGFVSAISLMSSTE